MRSWFLIVFGMVVSILIVSAVIYQRNYSNPAATPEGISTASPSPIGSPDPSVSPSPVASPSPGASPAAHGQPDLTPDANGLSKASVIMKTSQGTIVFKFYPKDAPKTVARLLELIQKGFYNGLNFHRVEPGFVIQGGDPKGDGTGGSGQNIVAEFNPRRHIEGTVAMARAQDPNSADSQFYISLGTHPHLDQHYTVFGQVTEGMDVAKKIKVGDKILSVSIQ